jgi:hypothetical protein
MRKLTMMAVLAVFLTTGLTGGVAQGRPKATKPKKKVTTKPTTTKPPSGGLKSFSCIGSSPTDRTTERVITGTINTGSYALSNVTITQTFQEINKAVVEQSVVVFQTAGIEAEYQASYDILIYRMNPLPRFATAEDVGKKWTVFNFQINDIAAVKQKLVTQLSMVSHSGSKGTRENDYYWGYIGGPLYAMQCTYL